MLINVYQIDSDPREGKIRLKKFSRPRGTYLVQLSLQKIADPTPLAAVRQSTLTSGLKEENLLPERTCSKSKRGSKGRDRAIEKSTPATPVQEQTAITPTGRHAADEDTEMTDDDGANEELVEGHQGNEKIDDVIDLTSPNPTSRRSIRDFSLLLLNKKPEETV